MFRNILVAIDGSPSAERALGHAADLAEALNARLTIVSVSPDAPGTAPGAGVDPAALARDAERETEGLLRAAADGMPDDLPVTTVLRHGRPGEQIVEQIRDGDHDLVVLGSRGRGRVASNLLGSVGGDVHFHSRVPMLIVYPEE